MNAITETTATEVQQIEAALDRLVTAAIANLRETPITPDRGPVSAGVIAQEVAASFAWTQAQRAAHDLLSRPVSNALRQAIRTLGKRLYEIGGDELMHQVCDRVSSADPMNESRRIGIIDHRWDGIGHWVS